jgi:hypothetical protein
MGGPPWWRPESWKVRDTLLFCIGVVGLTNEFVVRMEPRELAVYIFVLFLLGPAYLQPLVDAATRLILRVMGKDQP